LITHSVYSDLEATFFLTCCF